MVWQTGITPAMARLCALVTQIAFRLWQALQPPD